DRPRRRDEHISVAGTCPRPHNGPHPLLHPRELTHMPLSPIRTLGAAFIAVSAMLATPVVPALAPPAFARPAPDSFADLAERLPAVVNISSSQLVTAHGGQGPDFPVFPPGSPFEQFFKDFMERNKPRGGDQQPAPPRRAQSLGSGFIIDPSGIVVTNNHVID